MGILSWVSSTDQTCGVGYRSFICKFAIVVTSVFGLTSAVAVFLAVREVFGTAIANRTVLLYVFFPTSYILSMAYTEGLFVTFAALCLFALSRRYFVIAGLCAVAASLTRDVGVVLIACVAVVAIPAILEGKERVRPLIGLLISPVGFVGWLVYSWHETGTPFAFMKAENTGAAHTSYGSRRHFNRSRRCSRGCTRFSALTKCWLR